MGAAGAGKSTFAARHFAPGEVLSSDAFREQIAGDAADQRATSAAFAALHRALRQRMADGRLTVVDATSVAARDRRRLLEAAMAAGVPAVAIVLDLPVDVVLARNASRGHRAVPERAVHRHLARLRTSLGPPGIAAEGFEAIVVLRTAADVDAVRILRAPAGSGGAAGAASPSSPR